MCLKMLYPGGVPGDVVDFNFGVVGYTDISITLCLLFFSLRLAGLTASQPEEAWLISFAFVEAICSGS